jgi:RND family efflux transporter MFP subunit
MTDRSVSFVNQEGYGMGRREWLHGLQVLLVIVLAVSMTGCSLLGRKAEQGQSEQDPVPVRIHEAGTKDLTDYLRFSGRVTGAGEIPIIPLTSGFVKEVRIRVGDWVKKNDVVVILDDRQIQEQIDRLQETADDLRKRLTEIEKEVEELLASDNGGFPDNALDRLTEVTRLMSEMQLIAGQLGQVESAIAQAKLQKDNMTIKAQAAGKAAIVSAVPGGVAATGSPVAVLVDTSKLYVDIQVFENQIGRMARQQEAIIHIPAYSEYPLYGSVATISPVLNPQTRAFTVRVLLEELEKGSLADRDGLFLGMFARVEIPAKVYEQVLTIPREAVLDKYEGKFVYIVQGNRAVLRQVETGFNTNQDVQILTGIEAGDLVVVVGQYYLENGDPVNIRGWGESQ